MKLAIKTSEHQGSRKAAEPRHSAHKPTHKQLEAAPDFDRIVHERLRLGILSALAAGGAMTFNDLKRLLGATDGNLSVHARKLEEAEYILCDKSFAGRMPRTEYKITAAGRRALGKYLDTMEEFIQRTRAV